MLKAEWKKYILNFKRPAGTSRGVLQTKESYFLILKRDDKLGIGECGLLRGLSADDRPDYEAKLNWLIENIEKPLAELYADLLEFPSIQFGLEMAFRDLQVEKHLLFPSEFTEGKVNQPINGLIWMGDEIFMLNEIRSRLEAGFKVLKMKIGAISLSRELSILKSIRREYDSRQLDIRVDANAAFTAHQAPSVLEKLASLQIHSIEQPIPTRQWQEMALLCENSPVPIALDEELIGIFSLKEKNKLLKTIRPQYIIIKPSFVGGWRGSEEWIQLASENGIGWWATSALESNIGLNAIAQWNFIQKNAVPSGLGTGSLYTNNFKSPLTIRNGRLGYDPTISWRHPVLVI